MILKTFKNILLIFFISNPKIDPLQQDETVFHYIFDELAKMSVVGL